MRRLLAWAQLVVAAVLVALLAFRAVGIVVELAIGAVLVAGMIFAFWLGKRLG